MTQHEKDVDTLTRVAKLIVVMDASFILQEARYSKRVALIMCDTIREAQTMLADQGLNERQPCAVNHQLKNLLAIAERARTHHLANAMTA